MGLLPFGSPIGSKFKNGLETNRPSTPGSVNNYYYATDTKILYYSDSTAWQFAMDMSEGVSGPQFPVLPSETLLIAPGAAYTVLTASGGLTISQDTTNYDWGTQSIKMVTSGNGASNFATITFSTPIDLSEAILGLGIEIDSFTPYNDFQIRLSSDGFVSSNFDFCKPLYTGLSQRWVEPNLWEYITINRGGAVGNMSSGQWAQNGTGLASYQSVNAIRFKLVDNGGSAPMTIRLGFLSYFRRPESGILSITFDDSRLSQFTVAKPAMDAYRMRGTLYNIGYNVENAASFGNAYYNTTQLAQMQSDSRWEVGAHAFTDSTGVQAHTLGYDSLTAHDGEIDILQLKTFLRQQQALGIDSFALPHGTWSLNPSNTTNANPNVLGMMAQYFNTCATTYANTIETYPAANRMKLRRYVVQNTDTATSIMAMVNAAITNKWWLILAFHNLVTTPSSNTDFAISEFQSLIPQIATSNIPVYTVGEVWRNQISLPVTPSVATAITTSTTISVPNGMTTYTVPVNTTSAAVTVTLPDATVNRGLTITIKDSNGTAATNNITINTTSSQQIDGATSKVISTNYLSYALQSNGTGWLVI